MIFCEANDLAARLLKWQPQIIVKTRWQHNKIPRFGRHLAYMAWVFGLSASDVLTRQSNETSHAIQEET